MQPMCVRVYLTCVFIFKTHEVRHTAPTEPGNVSTDYAIRHTGSAHIVDAHVVPGATEVHASLSSCYGRHCVPLLEHNRHWHPAAAARGAYILSTEKNVTNRYKIHDFDIILIPTA